MLVEGSGLVVGCLEDGGASHRSLGCCDDGEVLASDSQQYLPGKIALAGNTAVAAARKKLTCWRFYDLLGEKLSRLSVDEL